MAKTDYFHLLVLSLRAEGYEVSITKHDLKKGTYLCATVTGNNIYAAFCESHSQYDIFASVRYMNGGIAADHSDCFDKWRKCPLKLPLPTSQREMDYLLERLKYWGSKKGREASNEFEYDAEEYPFRTKKSEMFKEGV